MASKKEAEALNAANSWRVLISVFYEADGPSGFLRRKRAQWVCNRMCARLPRAWATA